MQPLAALGVGQLQPHLRVVCTDSPFGQGDGEVAYVLLNGQYRIVLPALGLAVERNGGGGHVDHQPLGYVLEHFVFERGRGHGVDAERRQRCVVERAEAYLLHRVGQQHRL